ncbi:phytoene dehydrogenase [Halobacteriales archaeon SW_5_70_135]|nr:MAG: phytoene dehydrogenase [Halobacteriales archaeon SW_5_70_135]
MERAVVVGGGLAGLVAARHLAERDVAVTLLERRPSVGGRVRTRHEDGFTFDRGFQVLLTGYPAVGRELDVEALDLRRFAPGACIARPGRRSVLSDPFRDPTALTESAFNTEVTVRDKLRTLLLRRKLSKRSWEAIPGERETTVREYLRRRGFSETFVENFAAPFYGGITLDRSLSTASRVFEYTFKALSSGRTAVPAEGMEAIPRQLRANAERAGAGVETGSTVTEVAVAGAADRVEADGGTPPVTERPADTEVRLAVGGETLVADAVVVATDPPTARDLTGVESVPTDGRSCVTQYYALDRELGVGPRIVLNAADDRPNQVVPHTAAAPEYAPDGRTLLSATFLGRPDADRETLAAETRTALGSWFPERSLSGFERLHTARVPFAQFDQPPGVHESLPDARDPVGPVYLAGDYTRWSSIDGAMESGRDAARAALADADLA